MSRKNHVQIDGRLIQTDKKYSQLKLKQKEKIVEWMYQATKAYYENNEKIPEGEDCFLLTEQVYGRIEAAGIWIPFDEVYGHYRKKRKDLIKRIRRELGQIVREQSEPACFMNMCMIQDDMGNVLALDKVNDSYKGTTFPGGHVEKGESFEEAVIREVKEETGLTIHNPRLRGIYHWRKNGIHKVVFLYRTKEFEGQIGSSKEGEVYWISEEKFLLADLAPGMEDVWKIMHSAEGGEFYFH